MPSKLPWEISPALKPERLQLLDRTIRRVRNEVVDVTQMWEKGDDRWVIGCRAHRWLFRELKNMHESGQHPWMDLSWHGLHFSLAVDREHIRIYSGDPEGRPSERHLAACLRELERRAADADAQRSLFSTIADYDQHTPDNIGWFWMLAVDTDEEGRVLRTGVLQANENREPRNVYIIDDRVSAIGTVTPTRRPVELPPVDIGVYTPNVETGGKGDNGDGSEDT